MSTSPQTSSGDSSPSPIGDLPTSPTRHSQHHSHPHQQPQHRHQSQADRCSILQACEPCKKKKKMCNNQQPCQGCRETNQECITYQPRSISFAPTSGASSSSSASSSTSGTNRRLSSGSACETCRRRKTKCDGGTPCNFCAINNIECVNNSERRRRSIGPGGDMEALEERLRRVEAIVSNIVHTPTGPINGVDPSINGLNGSGSTAKQQQHAMQMRLSKLESTLNNLPQLQGGMAPGGHPHSPGTPGQRTPNPETPPHMLFQTSYMDPQPHHQYNSSYAQSIQAPLAPSAGYPAGPLSPPSLSPLNISSPAQTPPPISEHVSPAGTPSPADKPQHQISNSARPFPPPTNGYHGQAPLQPSSYVHTSPADQVSPASPIKSATGSPIPSPPTPGVPSPAGSQIPSLMDQLSKRTFASAPLTLPPLVPRNSTTGSPLGSPGYPYGSFNTSQPSPPITGPGGPPPNTSQAPYSGYPANGAQAFGPYPLPLTPTSPTTPRKGSSSSVTD